MFLRNRFIAVAILFLATLPSARAQYVQQGTKLIGSGARNSGAGVQQGNSIDVSADGNTMIVGGWDDDGYIGAAWIFTRANGVWAQQGPKLIGTGAVAGTVNNTPVTAQQGSSVAISGDGNTVAIGGFTDNSGIGAVWIFTRANKVWTQQGSKLTGSDVNPSSNGPVYQGSSVALSNDGNTLLVGAYGDNYPVGATWVYTRTSGAWTQQGNKLVGTGAAGGSFQGFSVALSTDGNTALIGAPADSSYAPGAAWVFTRSAGKWTQQGNKLTGTGVAGSSSAQGWSVALSGDGNTALIGGPADANFKGAVWVFSRTGSVWTQQGPKLVGTGSQETYQYQGASVSLSGSGNLALVGGGATSGNQAIAGSAWTFQRTGAIWSQQGNRLVPADPNGTPNFGYSVSLSNDATTVAVGAPNDDTTTAGFPLGASWVFYQASATHFLLTAPGAAAPGSPFSITVVAFDSNNNVAGGYSGVVHFTSTDPAAALPANTTLTNGSGTFAATLNTAGNRTITATDTSNATVTGTTNIIAVAGTQPTGVGPGSGSGIGPTLSFTFNDPRGYQDLDVVNVLINNFLDGRQACYLAYNRAQNVLYLVGDSGGGLSGMVLNGQPGTISNNQCIVNSIGSFATGSGTTLTLTLSLSFQVSFGGGGGNKVIYTAARDLQGGNSGWQALGTWNVPGPPTVPSVVSMTPARGAGLQQTFAFTFNDTKGFQDLGVVNVIINNALDGRNACYLAYSRPAGQLFLEKDDGSGLLPGATLGSAGTLSNSQCSVALANSSVSGSGNNLTLTLNITFTAAFAGNRVIYAAARDTTEANNSGWQSVGSWTVQ